MLRWQVFGTVENLKAFASLRTKYLLLALKEVISGKEIAGVNAEKRTFLLQLAALPYNSKEFDLLVVFDSVQFSQFWAKEWASLLQRAGTMEELVKILQSMDHIVTVQAPPSEPELPNTNKDDALRVKMSVGSLNAVREAQAQGPPNGDNDKGKGGNNQEEGGVW